MSPRACRMPALVMLLALVGPAVGAGAARASDTGIRATIKSFDIRLLNDEIAVYAGERIYARRHTPQRLVSALRHEVVDLHVLERRLSLQSPSAARGRRGRTDILRGYATVARAYSGLAADLESARGHPVPASAFSSAVARDRAGQQEIRVGLRLLGAGASRRRHRR